MKPKSLSRRKLFQALKHSILYVLIAFFVVGLSLAICFWVNSTEMKHGEETARIISRDGGGGAGVDALQQKEEDKRKERWEEYKIHVDLFKYYLDLILRTNLAVFAIVGGILTFYFKNKTENKHMRKALYLPCCVCLALSGFYFYCACLWLNISNTVHVLREDLGIIDTPYVHILSVLLFLFGSVFLGVGEAIVWFMRTDKAEEEAAKKTARPAK